MSAEQDDTIGEAENRMFVRGEPTRRDFCKGIVSMGVAGSAMLPLLMGCNTPSQSTNNSRPTPVDNANLNFIEWETEHDDIGTYSALVDTFNKVNKDGIHVHIKNESSDQQHDGLVARLKARQESPDVISTDVIWTDEFTQNRWFRQLDDLWPPDKRGVYLSTPLAGSTYQGKLWTAPLRTDVGLLYYRTDLIPTPPRTWSELIRAASTPQVKSKTRYGYVWQGQRNEGLVCVFAEMLSSCGGNILDPHNPKRVTINSPEARQALTLMQSLMAISPPDTLIQDRSDALWNSGDAAFMRHWPTYIAITYNDAKPEVALNFSVTSLPSALPGGTTRSCAGGWGLGINAYSKKQDAAWKFIEWMLQKDAQKFAAVDASFTVALESVYSDQSVLNQNPLYGKLPPIIKQAQLRPQSPNYPLISQAIQDNVSNALSGQISIPNALINMQHQLERLV